MANNLEIKNQLCFLDRKGDLKPYVRHKSHKTQKNQEL